MAYSPQNNAPNSEIIRYDLGWDAINAMLRAGRSLSGHERNCCFLNTAEQDNSRFADISGVSGLDFADDGRVLALADWDYDGDVDFWVANRSGPQIRYLQNTLPADKAFVCIKLIGTESNRDAIGARVAIASAVNDQSVTQTQTLKAGEGYLSQNSKWLHFGLGSAETVDAIEIIWPSGIRQTLGPLPSNGWYEIEEGNPQWSRWQAPVFKPLSPSAWQSPAVSDKARVVLLNPMPLPTIQFHRMDETAQTVSDRSESIRLVNLWATWCQPCLHELAAWSSVAEEFDRAGIQVLAINADDESAGRQQQIRSVVDELALPFEVGTGDRDLVSHFDTIQRSLLSRERPLPLPSSFLIDQEGRLRVVYKGSVDFKTILADAALVHADKDQILESAIPFSGKWLNPPSGSSPVQLAIKYIDNDLKDVAFAYIEKLLAIRDEFPEYVNASMMNLYGALKLDANEFADAKQAFELSLQMDSSNRQAHIELGTILLRTNRGDLAEPHFAFALEATPLDPELLFLRGMSLAQQRKFEAASEVLARSVDLLPNANVFWQLAEISIQSGDAAMAISAYESALKLAPERKLEANNLAWLLATTDDESLRDGQRALELAQAVVATRPDDPTAFDTLAAALAETGDFKQAEAILQMAIELASKVDQPGKIAGYQSRLKLYRERMPYRESLR